MSNTLFYVDKSIGNDAYAGSTAGAVVLTRTNVTVTSVSGSTYNLEDADSGGWGMTAVGDFVRVAGELARVTALAVGGDADILQVVSCLPGATPTLTTGSGKTVHVGGACASINGGVQVMCVNAVNAAGDSPLLSISPDDYTENVVVANDFTGALPLLVRGTGSGETTLYGTFTSAYDHVIVEDLAVLASSAPAFALSGDDITLRNLLINSTGGSANAVNCTAGARHSVLGCRITGAGGSGINGYTYLTVVGCEIANTGSFGATSSYVLQALGNVLHATGNHALRGVNSSLLAVGNTIYAATGSGIYFYTAIAPVLVNNLIVGCGAYGIESRLADRVVALHNAFFNNTSGNANSNVNVNSLVGTVQLTGDPFVDAAGDDFRIDPRTAAGRQLVAAGFPASILGLDTQADIGALYLAVASAIGRA